MNPAESAMSQAAAKAPRASTALLRLQADERLVAHVRRGNQAAFEVLVSRYRARLLAFCRHMLGANAGRDAEDVLQEVFTSAYRAMLGDTRPINVRPWLYRIARNRCLNHLRRDPMQSVEGMELTVVDERIGTAETVHQRAEVRQLLSDIQALPESQRTAILLREIDDLSYEQIAMAMDTTVAAVKSLLVRARVGLAEAAEARRLSCDEVRFELGQQAEGLIQKLGPASRRHVKECKSCAGFAQDLKDTNRTLAALAPAAGLILLVKGVIGSIGGAGHAGSSAAGGAAAGAGGAALGGGTITSIGGMISAKAATGLAAAVAVTGAAVEVRHVTTPPRQKSENVITAVAQAPVPAAAPASTPSGGVALTTTTPSANGAADDAKSTTPDDVASTTPDETAATTPATTPVTVPVTTPGATSPTTPNIDVRADSVDLPNVQDRNDAATVHPPVRLPVPMPSKTPAPSTPSTPAPSTPSTPAPAAPSTPMPTTTPTTTPAPDTTPEPSPEPTPAPQTTPAPVETTPPTTGE